MARFAACTLARVRSKVVVEGGGTLDANGDFWYHNVSPEESNMRPMMLDFMWVDGEWYAWYESYESYECAC